MLTFKLTCSRKYDIIGEVRGLGAVDFEFSCRGLVSPPIMFIFLLWGRSGNSAWVITTTNTRRYLVHA